MPNVKNVREEILLPIYKFKTGWSTRLLHRNEIFRIWGDSELCNAHMKQEEIANTTPAQPLSLLIHNFMKDTQQTEDIQIQSKRLSFNVPTRTAYFPQLDHAMNYTWIIPDITNNNNQKADKSPVPSAMWDQRILLTFPGRSGIKLLIKTCHTMLLRSYRRSLLLSFLKHWT